MPNSKKDNIKECKDIAERHAAQAVIVIRIERDGTVTTSTYGESERKCRIIGAWAQGWMDHALSVIPFRTVFGWGNNGVPLPLTPKEVASLGPGAAAFVEAMD